MVVAIAQRGSMSFLARKGRHRYCVADPWSGACSMTEYVYALTHPNMPGLIKIGVTTTAPEQHARELSASNIVPGKFDLLCAIEAIDAVNIEGEMHQLLAAHRVADRDFFEIDAEAVLSCFRLAQCHARPYDQNDLSAPDQVDHFAIDSAHPLPVRNVPLDDVRAAYTGWDGGSEPDET
ncbi:MAG: GIY-YIG nuclease family protein [Hyphomicrobiaceae bacterium]